MNALDAAISVGERILTSATRRFFMPTLALQGNLTNVFSREGAGSQGFSASDLPPEFSFLAETFKPPDDVSWSVGLNVSFPLFTGGEKLAVREKALKELSQIETERRALRERIEQRVRSALHIAGASYASIKQANLAAEAANKSLEVVQNSYSQGVVSIVDLLDAQNVALVTDQVAANAVYDFLIDLMEVERAYGSFDFFSSRERRIQFLERARQYMEARGISVN